MPTKRKLPEKTDSDSSAPSASTFIASALGFFSDVLKAIPKDTFLIVLWGVEVLLFVILALMIFFGNITGDQRFNLALVIIASVVLTFLVSIWKAAAQWPHPAPRPESPVTSNQSPSHAALIAQAEKCLMLLGEINGANDRIIARGRSGTEPWARMLTDTYNHVCEVRYRRRLGTEPADPYFDAIRAEPDVGTVCDKKWELGETLEDYRRQLTRLSPTPVSHDELELLIRRSVTQPNCTPAELAAALGPAIGRAKRIV
jgi:hypothetical protein